MSVEQSAIYLDPCNLCFLCVQVTFREGTSEPQPFSIIRASFLCRFPLCVEVSTVEGTYWLVILYPYAPLIGLVL